MESVPSFNDKLIQVLGSVVMGGMDHAESAQKLIDAYKIHYNFIREHGSIKKTPAEQAGIKLDLGQNKIENLIRLASKKP